MVTKARLQELLEYDQVAGTFIWRVASGNRRALTAANSKSSTGYVRINIDGRRYQAHRLAWIYAHGSMPAYGIDHINGVRTDNRIANLRVANKSENAQNLKAKQQLHPFAAK